MINSFSFNYTSFYILLEIYTRNRDTSPVFQRPKASGIVFEYGGGRQSMCWILFFFCPLLYLKGRYDAKPSSLIIIRSFNHLVFAIWCLKIDQMIEIGVAFIKLVC